MMSSIRLMSLLQVFFALSGMAWKVKEGYPLVEVPDFARLVESAHKEPGYRYQGLYTWIEVLCGISVQSIKDDWPWFSLHLFLYIGQVVPFMVIVMNESASGKRAWRPLRAVAALGALSALCGFSTAMPIISLWLLHRCRDRQNTPPPERYQRSLMGCLFLLSAVTHVGAFAVAFVATWAPSMLGPKADVGPLHVMTSLGGVPDAPNTQVGVAGRAARQARLRQINEMTGTSSGFFLTAGLLCHAIEPTGQHMTAELLVWMFLVSLVAGPAAGGAGVLLLRDWIQGGGTQHNRALEKVDEKRAS